MQLTLTISIHGRPIKQRDKRRYTCQSPVISQILFDVNKRMTKISPNDDNAG